MSELTSGTEEEAHVLYAGEIGGRPTIELRIGNGGVGEAFLVPTAGEPVNTGVPIYLREGKYYIECRKRKKRLRFKPEEVIRQKCINDLVDKLGYSIAQIDVEVSVVIGGAVHDKAADIVVYSDDQNEQPYIVCELKKPKRKEGIDQLKSYMNANGAPFGYWSDGIDEKYLLRLNANDFSKPIWRLPRFNESLDDIDEPLTRDKLTPIRDLYAVFKDIEQEILAHQSVDTFNEIFKVVFAKLYDERVNLANATSPAHFKMGLTEQPASVAKSVKALFKKAIGKWKEVYRESEEIELNDINIAYMVQSLQQYHLIRSGDVLGVAFEMLVNQEMKGDMGQYFTPRQVVSMMVSMLNPGLEETACDPAVGSGGFLIYAMRHVFEKIEQRWDDADDRAEQRKDYAQEHLLGFDNDPRLVRVAKAYMIMENDGRSGIRFNNSLDFNEWLPETKDLVAGFKIDDANRQKNSLMKERRKGSGVDIILTNPPFAGAIKLESTLRQYKLAKDDKGKLKKDVDRATLFLERCIDMLKPGGRMAAVLPQGIFNNITDQRIRTFVGEHCRILGIIGLHQNTFKPFTLAKTSVLLLQKWPDGEKLEDYPVFTAVSLRSGKTKLGRAQYLSDGVTLDCDMDEIAVAFVQWAKSEGLDFAQA